MEPFAVLGRSISIMVNLWLHVPPASDGDVTPPRACPRADCDGRRFRAHQHVRKAIAAPVRQPGRRPAIASATSLPPIKASLTVSARRYRCLACGQTFRVYPAGVGRGKVPAGVRRFVVALHALGLDVRGISELLGFLGISLGKSHVHTLVRGAPRRPGGAGGERRILGGRAQAHDIGQAFLHGADGWVTINGHRHAVRSIVDRSGRAALVVEGIDKGTVAAVKGWAEGALAALGVKIEVVYPHERREGAARRYGRPGGCGRHLSRRGYGRSGRGHGRGQGGGGVEAEGNGESDGIASTGSPEAANGLDGASAADGADGVSAADGADGVSAADSADISDGASDDARTSGPVTSPPAGTGRPLPAIDAMAWWTSRRRARVAAWRGRGGGSDRAMGVRPWVSASMLRCSFEAARAMSMDAHALDMRQNVPDRLGLARTVAASN